MKKNLYILLLLCTLQVSGQEKSVVNEKLLIYTNATVLTYAGGQLIEGLTGWKYSYEFAAVSVYTLGVVKEFHWEEGPSTKDITINLMGAITGYYLNKTLNKKLKKLYNKK